MYFKCCSFILHLVERNPKNRKEKKLRPMFKRIHTNFLGSIWDSGLLWLFWHCISVCFCVLYPVFIWVVNLFSFTHSYCPNCSTWDVFKPSKYEDMNILCFEFVKSPWLWLYWNFNYISVSICNFFLSLYFTFLYEGVFHFWGEE